MDAPASTERTPRRRRLKNVFLAILLAGGAVWWVASPSYIDPAVPFPPEDLATGSKSYVTMHLSSWNGGGTYYIVHMQGHAREWQGWTRQKVVQHFDDWLQAHGWRRVGKEEDGSGAFYRWTYGDDATHFRYVRQDTGDRRGAPWATVSVSLDREEESEGNRMWDVVLETVNPSWWTSFFDFD